jgi:hypothetical protein
MMPRIDQNPPTFAVENHQRIATDCSRRPKRIFKLRAIGLAAMLGSCLGLQTVNAGLPTLTEKPWLGIFGVFKNRHYEITINAQGEIRLSPHNEKGDILSSYLNVPISMGIEEVLPDGRLQLLKILPESLESTDSPTDKLKKTVIRGKVAGGAAFEASIEEARGAISIGGRVTDPGTETKNPLRFCVVTTIPYYSGGIEKDTPAKRMAYEATVNSDYLETKWTDGKRNKRMFVTAVDASSPEVNGPGIASAEIGIALFQGRKLLLSAATNSSMRFANANPAPTSAGTHVRPLYEGITITWTADQKKDPKGLARQMIQIK